MLFEVGETVVYPHHGAATITEVKTRIIKGEEKMYLKLNVTQGDLTIEVPADNIDLVGVRDVIGREGLDRVFEVLRAPFTEEPTNWSRRYKANLEKLASGDVIKVAEVVRDLAVRTFEAVGCEGLARVDVFVTAAGDVIVNEINTMPGFTPFSMYPRMWQESGIAYPDLIDELLQLALTRRLGLR